MGLGAFYINLSAVLWVFCTTSHDSPLVINEIGEIPKMRIMITHGMEAGPDPITLQKV
jgi:hypothetical protein